MLVNYHQSESDAAKIREIAKLEPSIGFLIKQTDSEQSAISLQIPNVMLTNQPPKKALKSHDKVKLYMTDGDSQNIYDAMYYGKPVLGFAKNEEDYGMMARVKKFEVGQIGEIREEPEVILKQM